MRDKPGRTPPPLPEDWADDPEWTGEDFANARPASEVHGSEFAARPIRRGRPPLAEGEKKEAVSIRLSPDVLAHFRAGGEGWQTRIDEALRKVVAGRR
ncbi:MAG: hypothetical protein QOD42_154 [Sphingomonadales bacterium]|jgi:uncharacterized protein (DUF4415 family)|nr:hypothetical protein [Sphingomonadales bacterium]